MLALLHAIPDALWGTLAGSLFTLIGVYFTNRSNEKRLHIQLTHERDLKAQERDLALRRDIYLDAAEAVAAGLKLLPTLAQIETPVQTLVAEFVSKGSALAKVDLVAHESTILALAKFTSQFEAAYMELMLKRWPLEAEWRTIGDKRAGIPEVARYQDMAFNEMARLSIDGSPDFGRLERLQQRWQAHAEWITNTATEADAMARAHHIKRLEYHRNCVAQLQSLRPAMIALLVEVRMELGLPINEATYTSILDAKARTAMDLLDGLIEKALAQSRPKAQLG